jgi:signal transduction histidine kinase
MPEPPRIRLPRVGPRTEFALLLAILAAALAEQFGRSDTAHSLAALVWILAAWIPVLGRRGHVVLATCVAAAVIVAAPDLNGHFPPAALELLLPPILAYSSGAHASLRYGLAASLALTAAIQIHVGFSEFPNVEIAIATIPPWWCGVEVRRRRQLVAELADRTKELEADETAFIALSVQRERARIARDLHDIVSHHLAVMVIQAGAGRLAEPWQLDVANERFATLREAGSQALAEADHLLTMLQPEGAGTAGLTRLLERARAGGARVEVTPPGLTLPPDLDAVAYRVVQEALTNAMKHAPQAALDIQVAADRDDLTIVVHNEQTAAPSPPALIGSGLGLAGMRERLEARGGSLRAGPEPDGGFRVDARLPLDEVAGPSRQRESGESRQSGSVMSGSMLATAHRHGHADR